MLKIEIIAVSRLRNGPFADLLEDYKTRIRWDLKIHEVEARSADASRMQSEEAEKILKLVNSHAFVIALDERGNGLKSLDFAKTLEKLKNNGETHIQFIIGGADGLTDEVRSRANMLLSFGQQTWPHMMARVMLAEQIYRAQQILAGHPYHRE